MPSVLICVSRLLMGILFAGMAMGCSAESVLPPLLLAEPYRGTPVLREYLVSEKLDGVRAYWDGEFLRFRSGRKMAAPDWFVSALPPYPLDGELWLGRGQFDAVSAMVRREVPVDAEWRRLRYMLFELPGGEGSFADRVERLQVLVRSLGLDWLLCVPQERVQNAQALQQRLDDVLRSGGEGLMLHRADAPYLSGRSDALLKLTPWRDAEARVVGHVPGKGRFSGKTGALIVEREDGVRFSLGSGLDNALRVRPPMPGTIVTYRYRELTPAGLPRFPRYRRIRLPE